MEQRENPVLKQGAKIAFLLLSLVIFGWSASLTISFISQVLPNAFWLVPVVGVVVFDLGMLVWLAVFLYIAAGAMQRALAIVLCLFDLVGVGLIVMAEILTGGQQLTAAPELLGTVAVYAIAIWTFINVAGVVLFHLSSPSARVAQAVQDERDSIFNSALTVLKERREQYGTGVANVWGDTLFSQVVESIPDGGKSGRSLPSFAVGGGGFDEKDPEPVKQLNAESPVQQPKLSYQSGTKGDRYCPNCHKPVVAKRNQKYCSIACREEYGTRNKR